MNIYTDGSSLGNPGPGGWGFLVVEGNQIIIEKSGGEKMTTNNRMELTAVIESFKYLSARKVLAEVIVHTDSAYVLGGVTSWIKNWEKNGWRTANKKEVLNQDLWKELDGLIKNFEGQISWQKVKGHSGHIYNDRADEIASQKAFLQK